MPPPGQGSGQSETGGWLVEPLSDFEVELLLINDNNKKVSDRGRHIFKIVESNCDLLSIIKTHSHTNLSHLTSSLGGKLKT